jgi:hypothetical protein
MNETPKKSLKDTLLSRIETEQVEPRSRLSFKCREYVVWSLWVVSILIGALAVAVSLFVVMHRQYALYETTHDSFFTFIVSVLPYVWFVVFGVMVFAAWYNFRNTKRGYRYSFSSVVLSSIVASVLGGATLQLFGFGYTVDNLLGEGMPVYMSQAKLEQKIWQNPGEGRLIGVQIQTVESSSSTIVFEDVLGEKWQLELDDLFLRDRELLRTQSKVRVLGEIANEEQKIFHACGIFPWMLDKNATMNEMNAERKDFVKKVYDQKHMAEDRLVLLEKEAFIDTHFDPQEMGVCAKIATVRRISASMQ